MTVEEQMPRDDLGRFVWAAALTATLVLAAASWVVALHQMNGMDMGVATELGSLAFFVAAWVPMMAAMMLPGAVPAVSSFIRIDGRVLAAPLFAGSYLAVWTMVGFAVYALYQPHGTFVAGALTVAAGVYELSRRSSAAAAGAAARASARDSSSGSTASARASGSW
jgi:predicted metal-binding membrane protein